MQHAGRDEQYVLEEREERKGGEGGRDERVSYRDRKVGREGGAEGGSTPPPQHTHRFMAYKVWG